ncbi:MAG: GNAT family N-acetyltransferase [Candidatus Rokuibacteriota bacterium]
MSAHRLTVRTVETADAFAALEPAWNDLLRRSGHATPFLSFDWFRCCWGALPPDRPPVVVLVVDAGTLVAIVPMMQLTHHVRRLPVRGLAMLESPDTPMADIITAGHPEPVVEALLDHFTRDGRWHSLMLQRLPAASPTLKALEACLTDRLPWRRVGVVSSPYLTIEGTWEAFFRSRSQRFRKTIRNVENRLERAGRVTIEEHRRLDPAGPVFAEALEVARRSWTADEGVSMATMARMPEFFAALTRVAGERGWLALWLLRLDGRPIAMEYQLQADGRVHALRASYDESYRDLSPGSALNVAIVRALFERGDVEEYDMGPGLNDYKLRWASAVHETVTVRAYGRSAYARLVHGLDDVVVPAARRVKRWLTDKLGNKAAAVPARPEAVDR